MKTRLTQLSHRAHGGMSRPSSPTPDVRAPCAALCRPRPAAHSVTAMRSSDRIRRSLILAGLLSASAALAWPVDVRQALPVGAQREIPLTTLTWAETDHPERVGVITEIADPDIPELELKGG